MAGTLADKPPFMVFLCGIPAAFSSLRGAAKSFSLCPAPAANERDLRAPLGPLSWLRRAPAPMVGEGR
ncbi:hypothetical protein HPP92_015362 [Vanilla planifolia]|uniref:Uncharacterized protein n=1 Tax=Vanilla planifolia TaxID=51239 RepID=A0A835QNF0_VANPL|nr:hypothetical protein HPP92_015362 [Vanilla planifolia]